MVGIPGASVFRNRKHKLGNSSMIDLGINSRAASRGHFHSRQYEIDFFKK